MRWVAYQALCYAVIGVLVLLQSRAAAVAVRPPNQSRKTLLDTPISPDTHGSKATTSRRKSFSASTISRQKSPAIATNGLVRGTGESSSTWMTRMIRKFSQRPTTPDKETGASIRASTPSKRAAYDGSVERQAAPAERFLREDMRLPTTGLYEMYENNHQQVAVIGIIDGDGPELCALEEAANDLMGTEITEGFTATPTDSVWTPYDNGEIRVRVTFQYRLRDPLTPIAMTRQTLAGYVWMAYGHRMRANADAGPGGGNSVLTLPHFAIDIYAYPAPPPPYTPPPLLPDLPDDQTDIFRRSQNARPWFLPVENCGPFSKRSTTPSPPPAKRCVRKCKHRQNGRCNGDDGTTDEGPVFTNDVPRRDNESTWIDPATGWQAVQISHAAKGFGYNISQANDYLAVLPCNKVDYWAQRMAKGDCGDDGAEAIAGMWFDVHSPTKAQQDDALAMLVAEHASNTGT